MNRNQIIDVPGREIAITIPLATNTAPAPECEPDISGLFWFSDSTGLYDQEAEAAYLLPEGAAGPALGVAGLLGQTCGAIAWSVEWTPASGTDGDPGTLEDGSRLIVYPLADTAPGELSVSATHDGRSYGPILLTILMYVPAIQYWQPADSQPLALTEAGDWYYDGNYGGCDDCLRGIEPAGNWPTGFRPSSVTLTVDVEDSYGGGHFRFEMGTLQERYVYDASTMPSALTGVGVFTLTFDLVEGYTLPIGGSETSVITDYDTGELGDITYLGIWLGRTVSGTPVDRRFTLTSIVFDPPIP